MTTATRTVEPRNGVDVPTLFATLDVVKGQPAAAQFQFRASNRWITGTESRSVIHGFFGTGQELTHAAPTEVTSDHPTVLVGGDAGPAPVEYLLHAIAACLTAGLVNIASARGVTLHEVRSTVAGDIDLNGILGLDDTVRNGYQGIKVSFEIKADASAEEIEGLVQRSIARSAVYDVLTNGVPVSVDVAAS